ncbi:LEA family epithelial adhesin, partial [Lactobacillus crispatus]|uniref:LEA family epithelial adhesin n=2 Tax=Lactobacillus crispatus TaxID=47770 RepID=UPI000B5D955A
MKQLKFLETKRTPRYSLRKLNVGVASVLLGVTIFGINFTNHSVKAATTESVENSNSSANSRLQQTSAVGNTTVEQTNTQKTTSAKEKVKQSSASKNATANNPTESATNPQSSPETQGSADTDIKPSAAKLAATNLVATSDTDRNAAGTVDQNNTNTQKATSAKEKVQQNGASNDVTEKVQQSSASKNATANNSTEAATTLQSAPKTQGSADTDIKSLAAKSAAKLATMNLLAMNLVKNPGTDIKSLAARLAAMSLVAVSNTGASTVDQNHTNNQPAKENQDLANKTNLTSSDNYSSNIYKGKDGNYYKIVTIYGNDYVYHAADIQANGTTSIWYPQKATTAADTKNNIDISKEDLGNGKTRWTVTFFPKMGLQNADSSTLHGLISAKFGIALTNDYQIVGNVDMKVKNKTDQTYIYYKFEPGNSSATDITVQNPPREVDFSFNPNTDVDPNTGLINSKTMPAYNNKYLQGSYYFTTAQAAGSNNLWQTYFKDGVEDNNAYDGTTYLSGDHDFHLNNFIIKNKTGDVDGAKQGDPIIYDTRNKFNSNGVFNSVNFNQAMEFKSHGYASKKINTDLSQYSSYVISFTTQHTDSHEVDLSTGSKNQQFSGISANIYSYQNVYYNMFSRLYGEQRALNTKGDPLKAKDIIPSWDDANTYMANKIKTDYLNNAQINVLRNKIQNNFTDPDALNNIVSEGNSLNDAMKNLGNSIGQYDSDGKFTNHKVDTTKASDSYKYADSDKKLAYDNATKAVSNIISVEDDGTVNKSKGTYADQATVEKLTEAENKAWNELNGVKKNANAANKAIDDALNNKKSEINNATNIDQTTKDSLIKDATDAANKAKKAINNATTNNDVATEQTKGTNAIDAVKVPSLTDSQKAAKAAVDAAAAKQKGLITQANNLSEKEKQALNNQVDEAAKTAKKAIDAATTNDVATKAGQDGKQAIEKFVPTSLEDAKKAANQVVEDAVAKQKGLITQALIHLLHWPR